ncbi:hypothetical protein CLOM_g158 [Closterium sp. NIES-68]|nr:hypothetical protein CLOM_g158 [Closterium sp. NIES-68]
MGREVAGAAPNGGSAGAHPRRSHPKKEEPQSGDDETTDASSDEEEEEEEEWGGEGDEGRAMEFSRILEGVVFAISGVVNPERAELRGKAMEMGARYRPDWTADCTLLVAAFPGTPKVRTVTADDGTIVNKRWVEQCYRNRRLMSISPHLMHLGRPWRQGGAADRAVEDGGGRRRRIVPAREQGRGGAVGGGDMERVRAFLEEQDEQPPEGEMERVAREGMLACFDDAVAGVEKGQALSASIASWPIVPRVLDPQTPLLAPPHLVPPSLPPLPVSLGSGGAGGGECLRALQQWRGMYERELGRMGERGGGAGGEGSRGGAGEGSSGNGGEERGGEGGGEGRGTGSGGGGEGGAGRGEETRGEDGRAGGSVRDGEGHGGTDGRGGADGAAGGGAGGAAGGAAAGTALGHGNRNFDKGAGCSNPIDNYDTDSCSEG